MSARLLILGVFVFSSPGRARALDASAESRDAEAKAYHAAAADDPRRVFYAVKHGDDAGALAAVDAGAPIDSRDGKNFTPLILAAYLGNEALVKKLLARGANPNAAGRDGTTALIAACVSDSKRDVNIVLALLARKADMTLKTKRGRSAVDIARISKRSDLLEIFERVQKGKSPLVRGSAQALLYVLEDGDVAAVMAEIDAGAPANTHDFSGATPLLVAANFGDTAAVTKLLSLGANPNAVTTRGWSPLIAACSLGWVDAAAVLIANKADINHKDDKGLTAKDWAKKEGRTEILEMFARLEKLK